MTEALRILLLSFLIVCALAVTFSDNMLIAIVIYMSYSLVMAIVWLILESPDLAITEAAVGAGVTSILFFVVLKKLHLISPKGTKGPHSRIDTPTANSSSPTKDAHERP